MQTRVLGGEAGRRGFFGGRQNRARTIGLVLVAVAGAFATVLLQAAGLVLTLTAAAVVFVATIRTHHGSLLARWHSRRRWRERHRLGTVDFAPVQWRPAQVSALPGSHRAAARAWNAYRDWPDGAEGMHWLQRGRGSPGVLWHTPTGEDAYLSVAFSVEGQSAGSNRIPTSMPPPALGVICWPDTARLCLCPAACR